MQLPTLSKTMDLKAIALEINLLYASLLLIPLLFLIFKHISLKGPPLPPGPYPLPIIGSILQMAGKKPYVTLTDLAELHGPLMSLRLGTQILIVGSSPAAATEILKTHDRALSGRYVAHAHPAKSPKFNRLSLGFASECNDQWKYLKALCRTELFSPKVLESQVELREKKVMEMVGFLGGKEGEVVVIGEVVFAAIFNTISNTFFSMDFMDFEGSTEKVGTEQ
ncbi:hypothetical protein L1049_021167 [Liquidambar formosana]|uniref:Uncharacterized protein n=1 Tax=Liquidambar formosana TaxID=63359 RepID=A0AAP0S8W2_LIQFO